MNFALYPHDTQECKIQIESRKSCLILLPLQVQIVLYIIVSEHVIHEIWIPYAVENFDGDFDFKSTHVLT